MEPLFEKVQHEAAHWFAREIAALGKTVQQVDDLSKIPESNSARRVMTPRRDFDETVLKLDSEAFIGWSREAVHALAVEVPNGATVTRPALLFKKEAYIVSVWMSLEELRPPAGKD